MGKETGTKSKKESLTLAIYNDLLDKLMTNKLSPGTIIDRPTLAEE